MTQCPGSHSCLRRSPGHEPFLLEGESSVLGMGCSPISGCPVCDSSPGVFTAGEEPVGRCTQGPGPLLIPITR